MYKSIFVFTKMDELIEDIGNTNHSRYIEKLIREDLEKRGKKYRKRFLIKKFRENEQ
jgi:metal-responsive CopG/Arc/MetJ family transcriptional regulator